MESQAAQKLERQIAKVEKKRTILQVLSALQMFTGPPYAVWLLQVSDSRRERSVIASALAGVGGLWSIVGTVGVYAVSRKRVQALVVFTTLEGFVAMLTSCAGAGLLLLHHLNCWVVADSERNAADTARPPWLQCSNVIWALGVTWLMVLYLSLAASEALSLRLRIQKTGKRNLNWNQKPQRWKERNLRRGPSAALRALTHGKDPQGDDDVRIKYLATHDRRYIARQLPCLNRVTCALLCPCPCPCPSAGISHAHCCCASRPAMWANRFGCF